MLTTDELGYTVTDAGARVASGTTGRPKGAMQSHRAVIASAVGTALMAGRTSQDRVITALPLFLANSASQWLSQSSTAAA